MATKKFLDSTGLQQVWDAVLDKDAAVLESAQKDTDTKLKDYLKSADVTNAVAGAIAFERVDDYVPAGSPEGTEGVDAIVLKDAKGNVIGAVPTADFVADGMLKSVTPNGDKLTFVFSTDEGEQTVEVDLSKYIDAYTGKAGEIKIENNEISIEKVDASKTKVSTDIQIAGGPLANNIAESNDEWPWKDNAGNKIIPQGKSLEEILTGLFLKVIDGTVAWPTVAKINETWTPSIGNISATIKNGDTALTSTSSASNASVVEVGTKLKVSSLTAGTASAGTRTATCTCSQGYYDSNAVDDNGNPTGTYHSGNLTLTASTTGTKKTAVTGEASLACQWNSTATAMTLNSTELEVVEGTNTLNVSQSGQTATCEKFDDTTVWAATNTKVLLPSVSATLSDTKPSDKLLTKSNDFRVVGKYKYFMGYSNNTTAGQFDSAAVRALTTKTGWVTVDGTTTIVDATAIKSNGKSIVVACPSKYKLASVNNGVGANILDNFTTKGSQDTVSVTTGGTTTTYNVYVYPITNGAEVEFKNMTLTKA